MMIWLTVGMNPFKTKWLPQPLKKIDMVVVGVILSEFRLFFTDMTYVPGQFIPYIFFGTKP